MTTTSATTSTSSTDTSSYTTYTNPYTKLGMSDFLSLLTTQMKNQDPTNPMDNTQMAAQMAQFSSLAGIQTTNSTLSTISSQLSTIGSALGVTDTSSTSA